jgi:hypothetical protein
MLKDQDKKNQLNIEIIKRLNNLQKKMKNGSSARYEVGG